MWKRSLEVSSINSRCAWRCANIWKARDIVKRGGAGCGGLTGPSHLLPSEPDCLLKTMHPNPHGCQLLVVYCLRTFIIDTALFAVY